MAAASIGPPWPKKYELPPELVSAIGSVVPVDWATLRAGSARNPKRAWLYFGLLANRVYEGASDLTDKLIEAYDMLPAVIDGRWRSLFLDRDIRFQLVRLLVYDHMHGEDIVEDKYGFLLLEHVVKLHKQLIRLQDDQLVRLDVMLARYVLSHIIDVNISRLNVNYVKDVIHTQEVKFVTRLLVFVLCTRGANHYLYLLSQLIERLDTIVFAVELKIDYYVSVPARRVWWLYMFVYLLYTVARFDVSMKVKRNLMEHMNQYRLHYLGRGMSWLVDDPLWGYALWSYTIDELNDWALDMFREIGGYCVAHDIAQHIIKHPIDVRCDPDHMEITDEGEGDRIVATIIGRLPSRILS